VEASQSHELCSLFHSGVTSQIIIGQMYVQFEIPRSAVHGRSS